MLQRILILSYPRRVFEIHIIYFYTRTRVLEVANAHASATRSIDNIFVYKYDIFLY